MSPAQTDRTPKPAPVASEDSSQPSHSIDREVVYTPESELRRGWRIWVDIYRGFLDGRELAWRLLQRNVRGMYRQTLLGLLWAFLPPLANALLWVFLNAQRVIGFGDDIAVSYPLYVLSGMIIWQSFIEAIQMPLNAIRQNRSMITKLNFPREALLLVGLGELAINLFVRVIVLVPLLFVFQAKLGWTALVFPLAIGFLIVLGVAIGLLLMPLGVLYQDIERLLMIGLPLWMILTPIIYSVKDSIPNWFHWFNPAAGLLVLGRDSLIQNALPFVGMAVCYAAISVPLLLIGLLIYRVSLPILIERMPA